MTAFVTIHHYFTVFFIPALMVSKDINFGAQRVTNFCFKYSTPFKKGELMTKSYHDSGSLNVQLLSLFEVA